MTNYHVFDQVNDPVYTHQVNTYVDPGIEAGPEADAAREGVLFIAHFSASVPAAQNLMLQVTNPMGSGRTMYISRVSGSSSASNVLLTLLRNGTFSGSAVTPVNLNFGSANTSAMTAQGGTGTVGGSPTTVAALILPTEPLVYSIGGGIVVPPGNSLTVTIGTGTTNAAAQIQWWEY